MPDVSERLSEIIETIHTIPSLPEISVQVMRMAMDGRTTHAQLAGVVARDPALAAKVMRMASCAAHGNLHAVIGLEQALSLIGLETLRAIALSLSIIGMFNERHEDFNVRYFWFHSAVSAGLCREIARRAWIQDPDSAYVIGLLKGIGKIILLHFAPDDFRRVIVLAMKDRLSFQAAARMVLGFDDGHVAAALFAHWGFDGAQVDAIRHHHGFDGAAQPKLIAMCLLADHILRISKLPDPGSFDPLARSAHRPPSCAWRRLRSAGSSPSSRTRSCGRSNCSRSPFETPASAVCSGGGMLGRGIPARVLVEDADVPSATIIRGHGEAVGLTWPRRRRTGCPGGPLRGIGHSGIRYG